MLEATVTLKSGKTVGLVAEDHADLGRQLNKLDYKKAEIKPLKDIQDMRQGKYAGGAGL